jgi:xylose isomerase
MATKEFFPGIEKIKFEGKDSKNPMAFRYYDAEKVINGKKMKDWLRFAMAWWHTLCAEGGDQFGGGTKQFPWNSNADAMQDCEFLAIIGSSGNVVAMDHFARHVKISILNNLEKSDAINERVYTKVLYKKATEAIDEIVVDVERFLKT